MALGAATLGQGIITTVAGTEFVFPEPPPRAVDAPLSAVSGVAADRQGNYFISDTTNNRVLKVDPQGILTVVAGTGIPGFSGDGGPAIHASIYFPQGVALDAAGHLERGGGQQSPQVSIAVQ